MQENPDLSSENLKGEESQLPRYRRCRSQLPIIRVNTGRKMPAYSNADLFELLEEEDVERNTRS